MALDDRKCAEEIGSRLGGRDHTISAAHCAIRLRLAIADNGKLDTKAPKEAESDAVKAGRKILRFDRARIKAAGRHRGGVADQLRQPGGRGVRCEIIRNREAWCDI